MNVQEAIARIFPGGVLRDCTRDSGDGFEVHGLNKNAVPQNCEVLASGRFQFSAGQAACESYLVKTEGFVLFFRIYATPPGVRYAEITQRGNPVH